MNIGVPKETAANERRVALTPDVAGRLVKAGFSVLVERGAGEAASFGDDAFGAAGATLVATAAEVFGQSDIVLKVQPPSAGEARLCREGAALVALFQPSAERETVSQLAARRVTAFSLALLPRITRAQPMDVLSSQATVAGYKAVLLAAAATGRFFPMLVTAAGTLSPARVLVLGAGVAGLQAIATARRLGAVVSAFDVRAAVKEQVESLGAKFLAMQIGEQAEAAGGYAKQLSEETHRRELAFLAEQVKDADVVITTAAIPGKRAPILITADAVRGMKPGSVIVDLAVEAGGDYWSMLFVFVLATFIGLGVIRRVSRLLYTPLMSLTNAISAIAVVGSIAVTGAEYPKTIRILGAIALFASMTNIVSGFLITDRMLKMFKKQ